MASAVITLVIAAFLSGAVTAVFVMLVAAVRAGDRRRLADAPNGRLDALTRNILGVGVRTGRPASHRDEESG